MGFRIALELQSFGVDRHTVDDHVREDMPRITQKGETE